MPTIEERVTLVEQKLIGLRQMIEADRTEFMEFQRRLGEERIAWAKREAIQAQADEDAKRKLRRRK